MWASWSLEAPTLYFSLEQKSGLLRKNGKMSPPPVRNPGSFDGADRAMNHWGGGR